MPIFPATHKSTRQSVTSMLIARELLVVRVSPVSLQLLVRSIKSYTPAQSIICFPFACKCLHTFSHVHDGYQTHYSPQLNLISHQEMGTQPRHNSPADSMPQCTDGMIILIPTTNFMICVNICETCRLALIPACLRHSPLPAFCFNTLKPEQLFARSAGPGA